MSIYLAIGWVLAGFAWASATPDEREKLGEVGGPLLVGALFAVMWPAIVCMELGEAIARVFGTSKPDKKD
ncbi:MAG: hypothetical protein ACIAXF_13885 [Phycisphaerales bacterium JB063]